MIRRWRQSNKLRAKFIANRERVRSWMVAWEIPEVVWTDEFSELPWSWIVPERDRAIWLKRDAPFLDEYDWMLFGRPLVPGVREVRVQWHFGAVHRFEKLDLTIISICDPAYLAEKLTLAVHQADLKGWRAEDAQDLYRWLVGGVGATPPNLGVKAVNRLGFVLLNFTRFPTSEGYVFVRLTVVETDRALDGSPLDGNGVSIPGSL